MHSPANPQPSTGLPPRLEIDFAARTQTHANSGQHLPNYILKPGRWNVTDTANKNEHESDFEWFVRALGAAHYWAEEDVRNGEGPYAAPPEYPADIAPRKKGRPRLEDLMPAEEAAAHRKKVQKDAYERYRARKRMTRTSTPNTQAHATTTTHVVMPTPAVLQAKANLDAAIAARSEAVAAWDAYVEQFEQALTALLNA